MMKVNYREGDWFAVPLESGGYAVGVVARANRTGVLLGYFFGPRHAELPRLTDVQDLVPGQAVLIGEFGHLGLKKGKWPILGRTENWDRTKWPMPVFVRYEELTGRSFRVYYDDNDPNKVLREEQVAPGVAEQGPTDGLMGAEYVEIVLTKALN